MLVPNTKDESKQPFPIQLSQTGLFKQMAPLAAAPGTIPYHPVAPMWNDHAQAEWLLGVPGEGQLAQRGGVRDIAGDNWAYPTNTVLARTLSLRMDLADPESNRRFETQMLLGWPGMEALHLPLERRADGRGTRPQRRRQHPIHGHRRQSPRRHSRNPLAFPFPLGMLALPQRLVRDSPDAKHTPTRPRRRQRTKTTRRTRSPSRQ